MEEYMDWYRIDQMRIEKLWQLWDNYHPIEVYDIKGIPLMTPSHGIGFTTLSDKDGDTPNLLKYSPCVILFIIMVYMVS